MNIARTGWLLAAPLATVVACSDQSKAPSVDAGAIAWVTTGDHAAFPSPLTVDKATAITIDGTYIYWITTDAFLYRAPRAGGDVSRVPLSAPGIFLAAHNDIFVGWTDGNGNAAVADIETTTGNVIAVNQQPGALRALVGGQRGYSFATTAPDGTLVETCLDGSCPPVQDVKSTFKGLALDLPTKTFYVLTTDGLRTCTLSAGCPGQAATLPAATTLIAALPAMYFLLDSTGQALGMGGSPNLGSPAVPGATKFIVVDGNGHTSANVGTWSNGTKLAQALLTTGTTTAEIATACTDFDVDATGRPIYCLAGASAIQIIP